MKGQSVIEFAWLNAIRNKLNLIHSDDLNIKRQKYFERVDWTQCSWMFRFIYLIFTNKQLDVDNIFKENKYLNKGDNMLITGIVKKIKLKTDWDDILIEFSNNISEYPQQINAKIWKTDNDPKREVEVKEFYKSFEKQSIKVKDIIRVSVEFSVNMPYNNIKIISIEKLPEAKFLAKYEY